MIIASASVRRGIQQSLTVSRGSVNDSYSGASNFQLLAKELSVGKVSVKAEYLGDNEDQNVAAFKVTITTTSKKGVKDPQFKKALKEIDSFD